MKILLINYRYFISGGPERYLFNIKELLEKNGHTVIPFSVKSNFNVKSEYEKYFLNQIGTGNEVYAEDYKKSDLIAAFKVIFRIIYSFEARRTIKKLIRQENPDIAYILKYHNRLSCSIIHALHEFNIPMIHRVSDFGHICVNNTFYHNSLNAICEECLNGKLLKAIQKKCVKNSYIYSLIKVIALKIEKLLKIHDFIDYYIFPSKYTLAKYVEFGLPKDKCVAIPTFFNFNYNDDLEITYGDYALYIGRIEPEKGLKTLLDAFINTEYNLKIIGFSGSGYDLFLKEYLMDKRNNIEFLGRMEFKGIKRYLSKCLFTIIPSEWYDNMPNTILESYAFKKAIVASDLESFKEFIIDQETGLLFRMGSAEELRNKVEYMFATRHKCIQMGEQGYQLVNSKFSANNHYENLIRIFNKTLEKNKYTV